MRIYFKNGESIHIGGEEGRQMKMMIASRVEMLMTIEKKSKGFITLYPNVDDGMDIGAQIGLILNLDEVVAVY